MPSNSIKHKGNLGKIIPVALKYLIYAMQNSLCGTPQAHRSDLTPVKYPTGVTDSSRKYPDMHWNSHAKNQLLVVVLDPIVGERLPASWVPFVFILGCQSY
jgi:hypothetical protein